MVGHRRRGRLQGGILDGLITYACGGMTARAAVEISGVDRNTATLFCHNVSMTCRPQLMLKALRLELALLWRFLNVDGFQTMRTSRWWGSASGLTIAWRIAGRPGCGGCPAIFPPPTCLRRCDCGIASAIMHLRQCRCSPCHYRPSK
jgi:hypothetical protein